MPTKNTKSVAVTYNVAPEKNSDLASNLTATLSVLAKHDLTLIPSSDGFSGSINGYLVSPTMEGTIAIHNKLSNLPETEVDSPKDLIVWLRENPNKATKVMTPEELAAAAKRGADAKNKPLPEPVKVDDFGVNVAQLTTDSKKVYDTVLNKMVKAFLESASIKKVKEIIPSCGITAGDACGYEEIMELAKNFRDTIEAAEDGKVDADQISQFKTDLFAVIEPLLKYKPVVLPKFKQPPFMIPQVATVVYDEDAQTIEFDWYFQESELRHFKGTLTEYFLQSVLALDHKIFGNPNPLIMAVATGAMIYDTNPESETYNVRPEHLRFVPDCGFKKEEIIPMRELTAEEMERVAELVKFLYDQSDAVYPWLIVNPFDYPELGLQKGMRIRTEWKDYGCFLDGDIVGLKQGLRVRHDDMNSHYVLKHQSWKVIPQIPEDILNWGREEEKKVTPTEKLDVD